MRVLAGLVVRRHHERGLEAGVLRVFAQHLVDLVVLVGGDKQVGVALLAGEVRGAGIGADQERARVGYRLHDRDQDVGEDRADHEVDLVALDIGLGLRHRDVGLELVVLHQHVGVASAELAAEFFHRELEAVALLLAEHGRRARQRRQDADLHFVLCAGGGGRERGCRGSGQRDEYSQHRCGPLLKACCARNLSGSPDAPADPRAGGILGLISTL